MLASIRFVAYQQGMICHNRNVDKSRNKVFTDALQAVELENSGRSGTAAIGPNRRFAARHHQRVMMSAIEV
jgi:hypothetical protein